ncbi:MAG: cupin domain-containing protein [Streptosporangiales bacterium]|nr:cupin domain-containing protein [Streptosporangiales bacterium]
MPRRSNGPPDVRIGGRLRAARRARGLTLEKVAGKTGVTKGFLSRLERDDVSPSVASLVAVCNVLGLRVGDLFEPAETSLVRAGEGPPINFGGRDVAEVLLTPGTQSQLRVIHSLIAPGGGSGDEEYSLDCDAEFVYVIAGELELVHDGQAARLSTGDAFTFPGRAPHTWHNPSPDETCSVLWVLSPAP